MPEIELGKVAMQVSFAAMLIDAGHAAFEDGEHVFDRVGVHDNIACAAGVFLRGVLHRAVAGIFLAGIGVEAGFVGIEGGVARHVAQQRFANGCRGGSVDLEGAGGIAGLDQRGDAPGSQTPPAGTADARRRRAGRRGAIPRVPTLPPPPPRLANGGPFPAGPSPRRSGIFSHPLYDDAKLQRSAAGFSLYAPAALVQ